jgi:hypothetical protein
MSLKGSKHVEQTCKNKLYQVCIQLVLYCTYNATMHNINSVEYYEA